MNVFDSVRVVVYRFHEKGLEIFLVNTGLEQENWRIPFSDIAKYPVEDIEVGTVSRQRLYCIRNADGDLEHVTAKDVAEGMLSKSARSYGLESLDRVQS